MYFTTYNMTDMLASSLVLLFIIIGCLIAGYILVRFKFYPIIYFIRGAIIKDRVLSDIENVHLKNIKQKYGKILSIIPILGFSWGLFGISLTCSIALNKFFHYISSEQIKLLLNVVSYWILTNILLLSVIPVLFIFTRAKIPVGMKRSFSKKFFVFIIFVLLFGLFYSFYDYKLDIVGLMVLLLLSIPCIFSTWFIGQYIAVYVIRSYYQSEGWDFVLNEKISIFGRLKGVSSLIFALLTPILAINSLTAVIFNTTNKGGFIGIWLLHLPQVNIHLAINLPNTWTFTVINPWTFVLTKPSFTFLTNIVILFLIVGPLVTFIFRPTYIFELTLNSKIYQTLINFNWENLKDNLPDPDNTILIHSLSIDEMAGVLIFFISFINYIAILSVGAVIASFNISLNQMFGLGDINGTIKLIEIPILFFVEYLILHDLSEERELVHLATKGKVEVQKNKDAPQLRKKMLIPAKSQLKSLE